MSPPFLLVLLVALVMLAIVGAGYKEWLEFKAKHESLGTSTEEVERHLQALREDIDRLEETRDALQERIQNLETIVTSETWIAQHDEDGTSRLSDGEGELELPPLRDDETRSDADRSADIARRLRNQ